jgi:hypothetical protein
MLSPGVWPRDVPKDPGENLEFRLWLLKKAEDPVQRDSLRRVCSEDILFYLNAFCFTFDPRRDIEVIPLLTWDFQDHALLEILRAVDDQRDLQLVKTRDMTASWSCLMAFEWMWHFKPWKKFLAISRNADAVDADDPDSLFWKLDFVHRHQPAWLMPKGYDASGSRNTHRKSMVFKNPETHSTITGQASTGKAGVGGRATAMFIDEFSQIQEADEVLRRTADTTGCRILNYTHTGTDTAAYRLSQRADMRRLVLHWTQHPLKGAGAYHWDSDTNRVVPHDPQYRYPEGFAFVTDGSPTGGPFPGVRSPWYDAEVERRHDRRAIAMDLDIDAAGSNSQYFDPILVRSYKAQYARDPVWRGDLHYDRDRGRPLQLVPSESGSLKLWVPPDPYGKFPLGMYFVGCDVAAGTGATPSCASVGRMPDGLKVAEYSNPFVSPEEFAAFVVSLSWLFDSPAGQGAHLIWEADGGTGAKFGQEVVDKYRYSNCYFRVDEFSTNKVRSDKPGWYAHPVNRRTAIEDYRAALYQRRLINRSAAALDETLQFVYTSQGRVEHSGSESTNDPTGARENHGDLVVADMLMWKVAKEFAPSAFAPKAEEVEVGSLAWRRELNDIRSRETSSW